MGGWRAGLALGLIAMTSLTLTGCGAVEKLMPVASTTIAKAQAEPAKAGYAIDGEMVKGTNAFSLKLLEQVDSSSDAEDNVVLSPASVAFALGMVQQGAKGDTAGELARVLGGHLDISKAGQGYANLIREISRTSDSGKLEIANGMWVQSGYKFEPAFIQADKDYFGAQVATADLSRPGATVPINRWIERRTHGRIQRVVGTLPPATRLVLVNTVYFKGAWDTEFSEQLTRPRDFTLGNGERVQIPTMERQSKGLPYLETETYQAAALRYTGGTAVMYVFLPKRWHEVTEVAQELAGGEWAGPRTKFEERAGELRLPKFHVSGQGSLIPQLQALGLKAPFDRGRADFSGMTKSEPLSITGLLHAADVVADENGTEAAATAAAIAVGAASTTADPTKPFTMDVDRPFLFVIADGPTNLVLFAGIVRDPA